MKEDSFEFDITKYKKFSSGTFQFPSVVTLAGPVKDRLLSNA